jgi:hypothetical protein
MRQTVGWFGIFNETLTTNDANVASTLSSVAWLRDGLRYCSVDSMSECPILAKAVSTIAKCDRKRSLLRIRRSYCERRRRRGIRCVWGYTLSGLRGGLPFFEISLSLPIVRGHLYLPSRLISPSNALLACMCAALRLLAVL